MNFNSIPADIRTPGVYVEVDSSSARQGLSVMPHKILIIGQRLSTGLVAALVPTQINNASDGEVYFGRGSLLAILVTAVKSVNRFTEVWALALDDDGAGVAATGAITFSGTATAAGTVTTYVGGERFSVGVVSGATAASVATAMQAKLAARTDMVVTSAIDGGNAAKLNFTCRHKGAFGNDLDLRVLYQSGDRMPAGLAAAVTGMANGAGNPDVADAITAFGDTWWNTLVMPYTDEDNLTALKTRLEELWGPMEMKEGHAFLASNGDQSAEQTLGDSLNSPHLTLMGIGDSPTPPWTVAAIAAGVDAAETDPARPRQTLWLKGVLPSPAATAFTREQRDSLLHHGVSTIVSDAAGRVLIERLITTYRLNAQSVADTSLLNLETVRTLAYIRYAVRARLASKFPRYKLANDGTRIMPGQMIVTPSTIRAELIALFRELEEAGLVENLSQFQKELVVERDGTDPNRINAIIPPDLINQLYVIAASLRYIN